VRRRESIFALRKMSYIIKMGSRRRWGDVNNKHEFDTVASLVN
jgi:hypothetical protein